MNPNPTPADERGQGLLANLRALPRTAWVLFAGTFINRFGGFVVPFLTLYLTGQGYSTDAAGLAVGAYGAGNLLASLMGGHLADKLGRRQTIVFSTFAAAIMMLCLSQALTLPVIVVLTFLTGLVSEAYRPAASALLTDLVKPGQRLTAFATLRVTFNAGFAFGPATAGLLAGFGYIWLFIGDAFTSALFGLVALLALPRGARSQANGTNWGDVISVVRRDKRFQQLLLANFAVSLVFMQMASTFGLFVTQLGFPPAVYGRHHFAERRAHRGVRTAADPVHPALSHAPGDGLGLRADWGRLCDELFCPFRAGTRSLHDDLHAG